MKLAVCDLPTPASRDRNVRVSTLDWPTGPHPTLSGSGPAPTADRSKTPVAGLAHEGLTPQGPLQKPALNRVFGREQKIYDLMNTPLHVRKLEMLADYCLGPLLVQR